MSTTTAHTRLLQMFRLRRLQVAMAGGAILTAGVLMNRPVGSARAQVTAEPLQPVSAESRVGPVVEPGATPPSGTTGGGPDNTSPGGDSTSPGGDSASRGGDGASRSGDGASRGGDGRPRGRFGEGGPFSRQEPPIGQEFEEVKAFIRSNMPSLEAAIADLRGTGNREAIRFLYGTGLFQYRRFTRGNREFPDMEATYLQDVRDTDELIGLAREYRISEAPRRDEIRGEMQKKLESVARSIMAERDRRIEKLRAALDREQKALERDQTQLEQNVGTRLGEFLSRIGAERNSQSVEPGEPPDSPGGRSALIPNLEKNRPPTTKPHKDR